MKTFLTWLLIDSLMMTQLVGAYTSSIAPLNSYLALLLTLAAVGIVLFGFIKKYRQLTYAAVAVPVSLLIAVGVKRFQDDSRLTNANKIIAAVEAYRAVHHQYPASLSLLVPGQLTGIPKNYFGFFGRDYGYLKSGNSFELKLEAGSNIGKVWLSSEQAWDNYD